MLHNKAGKITRMGIFMKILVCLFILTVLAACDPYKFGFKHNPASILDTALKAIMNQDHELFLEVTGKEALCIYGNPDGVTYLKENVSIDTDRIKINHKVLEARHFQVPEFVGYWSYFRQRYKVDVLDKQSDEVIIETIIDCNFGTSDEKDESLENLDWRRYKTQECRLIKILPRKFKTLPLNSKCEMLKVEI